MGNIFVQLMAQHCCTALVERVVASITNLCSSCHATYFSFVSCNNMLSKEDLSSTFCNKFFQLVTMKYVAWKVEHAAVIRATTLFNLQNRNVMRQVERKCCPYLGSKLTEVHTFPLL